MKYLQKLAILTLLLIGLLGIDFTVHKALAAPADCGFSACTKGDIAMADATWNFIDTNHIKATFNNQSVTFTMASNERLSDIQYDAPPGTFCGGGPRGQGTIGLSWGQVKKGSNPVNGFVSIGYGPSSDCQVQTHRRSVKITNSLGPVSTDPEIGDTGTTSGLGNGSNSGTSASGTTARNSNFDNGSAACPKKNFFFIPPWHEYLTLNSKLDCAPNFSFPKDILPVALAIIDMLLRLAGFIAIISVIMAGITYITAGGAVEKTVTAKRRIYNALIGLGIVSIAAGVVAFIGNKLV